MTPGLQLVALFTEMQERSIVINAQWVSSKTGEKFVLVMTKAMDACPFGLEEYLLSIVSKSTKLC